MRARRAFQSHHGKQHPSHHENGKHEWWMHSPNLKLRWLTPQLERFPTGKCKDFDGPERECQTSHDLHAIVSALASHHHNLFLDLQLACNFIDGGI